MSLLRSLRLYAGRCPYCGHRMRLYTWQDCPVEVPVLTHVRICPERHFMDAEHLTSRQMQVWDEGGKSLSRLAEVTEFPDLALEVAPIHTNRNLAQRKPPAGAAKPAAPAPAAPKATAAGMTPAQAPANP